MTKKSVKIIISVIAVMMVFILNMILTAFSFDCIAKIIMLAVNNTLVLATGLLIGKWLYKK